MTRSFILATLALILAAATACSSDGSDSDSSSPPTGNTPAASQPGSTPDGGGSAPATSGGAGGAEGTVQVNGQSFNIAQVLRCEPSAEGEDNLELILFGDGVMLFVYVVHGTIGESHELSLSGANAGGIFQALHGQLPNGDWLGNDNQPLDGPPFTIDGAEISGSMTLEDSFGTNATADVSFSTSIPSDVRDC